MKLMEPQNETLRMKTAEVAKKHKASWIELGQCLFAIHKDKMYKTWGYLTFEAYCMKDLGIKQTTAAKLLKSYFFLEKEEPSMVDARPTDESAPKNFPHYESVNLLRLAKENKNISPSDFADLREAVLVTAKEPKEVRAQVKRMLTPQEEAPKDPLEARQIRRNAAIKRAVTFLSGIKREFENGGLLPEGLLRQISDLTQKLQEQMDGQ